jgi:hypothetical protein
MGSFHLINKTSIEWLCKKQNTEEMATYGSEFVAACIATDQSVDLYALETLEATYYLLLLLLLRIWFTSFL